MRHIELKLLWFKDIVRRKKDTMISVDKVGTFDNTADWGTKYLPRVDIMRHAQAMNVEIGGNGDAGAVMVAQRASERGVEESLQREIGSCLAGFTALMRAMVRGVSRVP